MNFNSIIKAASGIALIAGIAAPAHAALTVLDGWQLATPNTTIPTVLSGQTLGAPSLTTNIGYLSLDSGTANVEQQLNASGQVSVGSQFRETGAVYTVRYVANTTVGPNDTAAPAFLGDSLTIKFTRVEGVVTSINALTGGFGYAFTSGTFSILDGSGTTLASGNIVGIGGNTNLTQVGGGTNGDSALLANITSATSGFDLRNSAGVSLLPALANGSVFFEATTNNLVSGKVLNTSACSFDATATCSTFTATSAGQAYLAASVPEPGTVALVGLALGGLGLVRRRAGKRSV